MRVEIRPPLSGADRAILLRALDKEGIRIEARLGVLSERWRQAAAEEAVDRQPSPDDYACSPRSTRGATRA